PPLVGSKGESQFATSRRAERANGGTIKIVSSTAINSDNTAAAPASAYWFSRRASTVTNAVSRPAITNNVPSTTRVSDDVCGMSDGNFEDLASCTFIVPPTNS